MRTPPAAWPEAVDEALQGLPDLLGVQLEDRREVDELVVEVGVVVPNDLQCVEDVADDAVGFGG